MTAVNRMQQPQPHPPITSSSSRPQIMDPASNHARGPGMHPANRNNFPQQPYCPSRPNSMNGQQRPPYDSTNAPHTRIPPHSSLPHGPALMQTHSSQPAANRLDKSPLHPRPGHISPHSPAHAPHSPLAPRHKDDSLYHHKSPMCKSTSLPLHPLSGASATDTDSIYCTEIARRSVARAALHLGLEGMEGVALDALGSVLLNYLEMAGFKISSMVESSGRSSAHANAYDALNVIEDCTAPAASHLGTFQPPTSAMFPLPMGSMAKPPQRPGNMDVNGFSHSTKNRNMMKDHHHGGEYQGRGWEGLATFLFGPNWYSIPLEGEDQRRTDPPPYTTTKNGMEVSNPLTKNGGTQKGPGGKTILPKMPASDKNNSGSTKGKQLPTLAAAANLAGEKNVSFSMDHPSFSGSGPMTVNGKTGPSINSNGPPASILHNPHIHPRRWDAPHLDTLAPFPLVSRPMDIANPHRLTGTGAALSLHDLASEEEACRGDRIRMGHAAKRPRRGSTGPGGREGDGLGPGGDGQRNMAFGDRDGFENGNARGGPGGIRMPPALAVAAAEAARLAEERAMREALRIPEDVYLNGDSFWGCILEKNDSKETSDDDAKSGPSIGGGILDKTDTSGSSTGGNESPSKTSAEEDTKSGGTSSKVRFDPSSKASPSIDPRSSPKTSSPGESLPTEPNSLQPPPSSIPMPFYVPTFFPTFPAESAAGLGGGPSSSSFSVSSIMSEVLSRASTQRDKRKLLRMGEMGSSPHPMSTAEGGRDAVRRSVIGLGRQIGPSYWGSEWLDNDPDMDGQEGKSSKASATGLPTVTVQTGVSATAELLTANAAMKEVVGPSVARRGLEASQIVPVARASGSRVSKILEGSMNVS